MAVENHNGNLGCWLCDTDRKKEFITKILGSYVQFTCPNHEMTDYLLEKRVNVKAHLNLKN